MIGGPQVLGSVGVDSACTKSDSSENGKRCNLNIFKRFSIMRNLVAAMELQTSAEQKERCLGRDNERYWTRGPLQLVIPSVLLHEHSWRLGAARALYRSKNRTPLVILK
jgi:hypothetical protein